MPKKKNFSDTPPSWYFNLATRNELSSVISNLESLDSKMTKFRDDMLTWFDRVMTEIKAIREEQAIITGKSSEHTDQLEDHEKRLVTLELTKN